MLAGSTTDWLEGAPQGLVERVSEVVKRQELKEGADLIEAAVELLAGVLESDGDRDSAYDLLISDALLTHALQFALAEPAGVKGTAERAIERLAALLEDRQGDNG